jgi:diguanylate cyclase (GGDEF)-like protein/PAS domain S-box-containing protein
MMNPYLLLVLAVVLLIFFGATSLRLMQLTRQLRESEERWKFALEGAGDGVWDWDVQTDTVVMSTRYKQMAGYTDADIAANEDAWRSRIHPDDRAQVDEDIRAYLEGRTEAYYNEHRVLCLDGSVKWVLARGMVVARTPDGKPQRMIGTHADITKRKAMEERMRYMAHYDPLTELPNRSLISDRLQQAVIKAKRDKSHMALMFLDLDKFKPVNDTLGHEIGDLLLKQVAQRLQDSVRASDTVARIGGDEFVVLLPAIEAEQDATVVAEKILQALNRPFEVAGHQLAISVSIGIAAYPEHGDNEKLLLINADIAMYHAKNSGRNGYRFFSRGMQSEQ